MADTPQLAQALYDFQGDPDNGELTFEGGEVLTIVEQDIGDGWWEAKNHLGHQGLIPKDYVQLMSEPPEPSFPPPPPPMPGGDQINTDADWGIDPRTSSYSTDTGASSYLASNGYDYQTSAANSRGGFTTQQSTDEWDDDWDDEDDDQSSTSTGGTAQMRRRRKEELHGQGSFGLAPPKREPKQLSPTSDLSKYGTVKKSFNRFSQFAKAGGEAFIMGQISANVSENDMITITDTEDGPVWPALTDQYTCDIKSPKKESKLKGLKSFIAYQLTPSFSGLQVSRRYKHFDWLHERLEEKFACIPIAPLPDKAISVGVASLSSSGLKGGRYEDDFITERMHQLQLWVNRMVRHPVISRSEVFLHFLTCTDEKKWKIGKRKAEKDEFMGSKFFLTLRIPTHGLEMRDVDKKMETFLKFIKGFDDHNKGLIAVFNDNKKKHLGPFKREYQKIGQSFKNLAMTFNLDSTSFSRDLTAAIDYTGDTYNEIGEMFSNQPRQDIDPLLFVLHEYKGMLSVWPDVLKIHEGAVGRAKECLKEQEEGKMTESDVQAVVQRADVISYGTMAQISHFQRERVQDFNEIMTSYLKEQIAFYREITNKLEATLQRFENRNP